MLTIKLDNTASEIGVTITNIQGQKVYENTYQTANSKLQLNVADFSTGVYFVQVQIGLSKQVEKIMIE